MSLKTLKTELEILLQPYLGKYKIGRNFVPAIKIGVQSTSQVTDGLECLILPFPDGISIKGRAYDSVTTLYLIDYTSENTSIGRATEVIASQYKLTGKATIKDSKEISAIITQVALRIYYKVGL